MAAALKHFLQFKDLSREELEHLFARTRIIKDRFKRYQPYHPLADRTLAMIFEKNSTRTRLSFEAGMHQLGGSAIYLNTRDTQLGRGEPVEDAAEVISRMQKNCRHSLIEYAQLQADARTLGQLETVGPALEAELRKERFVQQIFEAPDFTQRLRLAWGSRQLAAGIRLRLFGYAATPWIYAPWFALKRLSSRRRSR